MHASRDSIYTVVGCLSCTVSLGTPSVMFSSCLPLHGVGTEYIFDVNRHLSDKLFLLINYRFSCS